VAEISDRFADGLIQSKFKPIFRYSRLTVKVVDDWYNLKQLQQDKFRPCQMLERSKEPVHLEITNSGRNSC